MEDFILVIPKGKEHYLFTVDIILFVLMWLTILAGLFLCFWGYQYVRALFLLVLGCIVATFGIVIADDITQNRVLMMYSFVIFTIIGVCILYMLSLLLSAILHKLRIIDLFFNKRYIITAVIGGFVVGGAVYLRIYHQIWVAVVVSFALAIMGLIYGKKKVKEQKPFLTYDNLYRMQPLKEGDQNA